MMSFLCSCQHQYFSISDINTNKGEKYNILYVLETKYSIFLGEQCFRQKVFVVVVVAVVVFLIGNPLPLYKIPAFKPQGIS